MCKNGRHDASDRVRLRRQPNVLQFDHAGSDAAAATDLSHRYLWNPQAVDQLFADEEVVNGLNQSGNVLWALTEGIPGGIPGHNTSMTRWEDFGGENGGENGTAGGENGTGPILTK